jgi:hypothetical protein
MLGTHAAEPRGSQGGKGQIPLSSRKNKTRRPVCGSPLPGGGN